MAERVVCRVSDLPAEGEAREFAVDDEMVCVANVKGEITAMDNVCLHRGGPLGGGMVEEGKIVCPWHGWAVDLKTGAAAHDASVRVKVYAVRVEGEEVKIRDQG